MYLTNNEKLAKNRDFNHSYFKQNIYVEPWIQIAHEQGPTGSRYPTHPELSFKYPTRHDTKIEMTEYQVIKFYFESNKSWGIQLMN